MNENETLLILKKFCSMMSNELAKIVVDQGIDNPKNEYERGQRDALLTLSESFKMQSEREDIEVISIMEEVE